MYCSTYYVLFHCHLDSFGVWEDPSINITCYCASPSVSALLLNAARPYDGYRLQMQIDTLEACSSRPGRMYEHTDDRIIHASPFAVGPLPNLTEPVGP